MHPRIRHCTPTLYTHTHTRTHHGVTHSRPSIHSTYNTPSNAYMIASIWLDIYIFVHGIPFWAWRPRRRRRAASSFGSACSRACIVVRHVSGRMCVIERIAYSGGVFGYMRATQTRRRRVTAEKPTPTHLMVCGGVRVHKTHMRCDAHCSRIRIVCASTHPQNAHHTQSAHNILRTKSFGCAFGIESHTDFIVRGTSGPSRFFFFVLCWIWVPRLGGLSRACYRNGNQCYTPMPPWCVCVVSTHGNVYIIQIMKSLISMGMMRTAHTASRHTRVSTQTHTHTHTGRRVAFIDEMRTGCWIAFCARGIEGECDLRGIFATYRMCTHLYTLHTHTPTCTHPQNQPKTWEPTRQRLCLYPNVIRGNRSFGARRRKRIWNGRDWRRRQLPLSHGDQSKCGWLCWVYFFDARRFQLAFDLYQKSHIYVYTGEKGFLVNTFTFSLPYGAMVFVQIHKYYILKYLMPFMT